MALGVCDIFLFSVIASEMCYFFSVPLLCYAGLSAAGARAGTSSGGKKPSSAQRKASVPLPQLNPRMNSLHCPSHGARRRITRVDSKQRGTVEQAEACALHRLQSEHSHLLLSPVVVSSIRALSLFLFFLPPFHCCRSVHAYVSGMSVTLSACQIAYQTGVGC